MHLLQMAGVRLTSQGTSGTQGQQIEALRSSTRNKLPGDDHISDAEINEEIKASSIEISLLVSGFLSCLINLMAK